MNILITGVSRGIGRELALQLSEAGHHLLLVSRNKKQLELLVGECNKLSGKQSAQYIDFDLTRIEQDAERFKKRILEHTRVLDVLFNNAAGLINKPFCEISMREERELFNVNYFAQAELIRQTMDLLKASENPGIINVTSMAAIQGSSKFVGLSAYSSSKGALSTLTECLAEEFKPLGISVNALAFGAVQTEMLAQAFPGFRAPTSAAEMAAFCKWFIEEGRMRFNGKILPVSNSTP